MNNISTSRHIEKTDAQGRTVYSQAVNVSQFPARDVTVWLRAYDKKYLLPENGVFTAKIVLVDNKYIKDGREIRTIQHKFENLQPIAV